MEELNQEIEAVRNTLNELMKRKAELIDAEKENRMRRESKSMYQLLTRIVTKGYDSDCGQAALQIVKRIDGE